MFGTVIIDAYRKEEALEMADAIDDLCSPTDNYGWASAGIYCFWDYYAEAVLYIGLAGDLAERFKQHNGIYQLKRDRNKNKLKIIFQEMNDWVTQYLCNRRYLNRWFIETEKCMRNLQSSRTLQLRIC